MQMGYRCRGCSTYENMEYHDWQCPHCGYNNLEMKIKVSIEIEADLPEDEVRAINELPEEGRQYAIKEIKKFIKNVIKHDMDFEEDEHVKKLEVEYE
jgi:DNA-directed RNA polymerase subunit RPC12/RpoP